MNKILFTFLIIFSISICASAQENSIDEQFKTLTKKSNNYKDYKVVKKAKLNTLHKNVLDSIDRLENKIALSSSEIVSQKTEINLLKKELSSTKDELVISREKEDGIHVFGVLTKKTTYNIVAISIIGILLAIIIVLFFKYKKSFMLIKSTKEKLVEIEEEYESYRQRSLEREQQLRRKLQDEINKNK